jgi:aryl-alcohol dehydrogenase-like predicted oxidoreductase
LLLLLQVMGEDVDHETLTRILLAVMAHEPGRGEADVDEQAAQQLAALKPAGPREGDVGKAQAAAAFIMRRFGKSAAQAAAESLEQVRTALGWDVVLQVSTVLTCFVA